jgi:hypothetical protein
VIGKCLYIKPYISTVDTSPNHVAMSVDDGATNGMALADNVLSLARATSLHILASNMMLYGRKHASLTIHHSVATLLWVA